jgi:competence protein ComEA
MDGTGGGGSSSLIGLTEPPRPPDLQTPSASGPPTPLPQPARPVPPAASRLPAMRRRNGATAFWITHADQLVLALLSAIMLVLLAAYWVRLTRWGTVPVEVRHLEPRQLDFRIDVNSATWVEWGQLDGIGDAMARRIVADREENGPFRSIEELRRVKGIGPKTLERLRPWLSIGPQQPPGDGLPATGTDAP